MLIDLDGQIINTDAVRKFERLPRRKDEQYERVKIIWLDGGYEVVDAIFDNLTRYTGQYVPAPAGYQEITAHFEDGEVTFWEPMPVVAFRISGPSNYDMKAVTLEGEASQWGIEGESMRATIFPDGRCYNHSDSGLPMPLEDWKAETIRRMTKASST